MNATAHKTAIKRRDHSAPVRVLLRHAKLAGRILDYGCGKGYDCDALGCEGYDPHYRPEQPTGQYDTILCMYVLNVVTDPEVEPILSRIRALLAPGGVAYIGVRRDVKREGYTSKGTYQVNRELDLPVEYEKRGSFIIYRMEIGNDRN